MLEREGYIRLITHRGRCDANLISTKIIKFRWIRFTKAINHVKESVVDLMQKACLTACLVINNWKVEEDVASPAHWRHCSDHHIQITHFRPNLVLAARAIFQKGTLGLELQHKCWCKLNGYYRFFNLRDKVELPKESNSNYV